MSAAALGERGGLERTIQSWVVGWGIGGGGADANPSQELDSEALLRQQNAANDELCSENGRLRADIERLRAEERADDACGDAVVAEAAPTGYEEDLADKLSRSVLEAVQVVLANWSAQPHKDAASDLSTVAGSSGVAEAAAADVGQPERDGTGECSAVADPPGCVEADPHRGGGTRDFAADSDMSGSVEVIVHDAAQLPGNSADDLPSVNETSQCVEATSASSAQPRGAVTRSSAAVADPSGQIETTEAAATDSAYHCGQDTSDLSSTAGPTDGTAAQGTANPTIEDDRSVAGTPVVVAEQEANDASAGVAGVGTTLGDAVAEEGLLSSPPVEGGSLENAMLKSATGEGDLVLQAAPQKIAFAEGSLAANGGPADAAESATCGGGLDPEADPEEDEESAVAAVTTPASLDGLASARHVWKESLVRGLDEAIRAAVQEEAEHSTPMVSLTPAEETAALVGEKIALRELVEQQLEQIRLLEKEFAGPEPGPGSPTVVAGGQLADTLSGTALRRLSDAGGQLSAGLSTGLSAVLAPPPKAAKVAVVGAEYEVIGRSGAIVRKEESLQSARVANLQPGHRVRVVAVSESNPRRVEIVSIMPVSASASSREPPAQPQVVPAPIGDEVGGAPALTPPGEQACAPAEPASACGDGASPAIVVQGTAAQDAGGEQQDEGGTGGPAAFHAPLPVPIVGWISACSKDSRMLIRLVNPEHGPGGASGGGAGADHDGGEEGSEEVTNVTLSTMEWDCLHQDAENSARRVEALAAELNGLGVGLLHSFEMRSVLGELQLGVGRAQERATRMREAAALAQEELLQHRFEFSRRQQLGCRPGAAGVSKHLDAVDLPDSSLASAAKASPSGAGAASGCATSPGGSEGLEAVDWDRLISERETTAAALSAALQRLACLEREDEELQRERDIVEGRNSGELGGLRRALRRIARPTMAAVSRAMGASSSDAPHSPSEALFQHRISDLRRTVEELKSEVFRMSQSEAALRRSVDARRAALKTILRKCATAALRAPPQCGPFQLPASADAERAALRAAVEEQLLRNLRLSSGHAAV